MKIYRWQTIENPDDWESSQTLDMSFFANFELAEKHVYSVYPQAEKQGHYHGHANYVVGENIHVEIDEFELRTE